MPSRLRLSFVCLCLAAAQVRGQESQAPNVDLHPPARITQPAPIPAVHGRPDRLVGSITEYLVNKGDTLRSIGARFGIDSATLVRENGLPANARLASGQVVRIDNRHIVPAALDSVELIVNVPQRMLFHRSEEDVTVGYPVAVGRPSWPTPSGAFVVDVLERHPTWNVPASILEESRRRGRIQPAVVPPGPDNPLGEFWIGLSRSGLGIHGTNAPSSIFGAVSHGCVRVHPDDIARLFGRTRVGALGRIIYEPVLLSVVNDAVYLEVHRDVYGRGGATARELAMAAGVFEHVDWTVADIVTALRDGIARDVTRRR